MRPRHPLDEQALDVEPTDAREIDLFVLPRIDPPHSTNRFIRRHLDHADARNRIRRACLGIVLPLRRAVVRQQVHERVPRHRPLIQFEEGDALRIRRPPVRLADVQLLGIDPVELAVEHFFTAAEGKLRRLARGQFHDPHIVIAHEAHPAPVGRNPGVGDGAGFTRGIFEQPLARLFRKVEHVQIVVGGKEQRLAVRHPLILLRRNPPEPRCLRSLLSGRRKHLLQFLRINEQTRLCLRVREVNRADLDSLRRSRRRLHEREQLAVGTPLHAAQKRLRQSRSREDFFDGQAAIGRRRSSLRARRLRHERDCHQSESRGEPGEALRQSASHCAS